MPKKLRQEQIQQFHDQGYLCPIPVFSPEEMAHYRAKLAEFEAREGGSIQGHKRNKSHLFLTWLDELVRHPAILDPVEDILGPNILLYHAQWFIKEPHTEGYVSFHQDAAYWGLEEARAFTAWLAFEDADAENGCMQVIPGTHRQLYEHKEVRTKDNLLWRGQTADLDLDLSKAVNLELKTGEMSFHHSLIVHGSHANRSDRRRAGYAIRYIPTDIRRVGPRESALLVRGEDTHGYFDLEPRPAADYHPDAVRAHQEICERFMEHYLTAEVVKPRTAAAS